MAGLRPERKTRQEIINANQSLIEKSREFRQAWAVASDEHDRSIWGQGHDDSVGTNVTDFQSDHDSISILNCK